jgi:hypothetical protein
MDEHISTAAPGPFAPGGAFRTWLRTVGLPVLGIALYALLLDTAVETLLAGSPVRWGVCGAVGGYFGLTALLRRRLTWTNRTVLSALAFLGIVAVTGWLPEGLARGTVLLRQPTSTVLTSITTLAVLFAATVIVRMPRLPLAAKVVVALLAAYGAVALIAGGMSGTSYPALLQGHSLWQRLPFWLQGAFIGALVLVPIAFALETVHGLARIRKAGMSLTAVQVASLGMSVALAVAGLRAPEGRIVAGLPRPFLPALTLDRGAYLNGAGRLLEHSGLRTAKVEAAAKAIGSDLDAMLSFMRAFAFDPYRGSLRGALGTLMTRGGNALDRSLLLVSLLRQHRYHTRLVHGRLPDVEARRLLEVARRGPVGQPPEEQPVGVEEAARISGLPVEDLRALDQAIEAKGLEVGRLLRERVRRDVAFLQRQLEKAQIRLQPAAGPTLEDVRDHVWVQVEVGGEWRDLDSLVPLGRVGERLTEPEGEVPSDPLPEAWVQTLRLRLVVTYRHGNALEEQETLDVALRVPDLAGRWLVVGFPPQDGGNPPASQTANAFRPVLLAGNQQYTGHTIYLDASRARRPGPAGMLGVAKERGTPQPLERLWLEFTLSAPGADRLKITRTIVRAPDKPASDTAARIERARMELVSLYHFVAAPGSCSTEWLATLHLAMLHRKAAGHSDLLPLDLLHLAQAMARSELGEVVGQVRGLRRYYAHPLLLGQRVRFRKDSRGRLVFAKSIDILQNRSEILASDPVAALRQGVLDTHLERLLLEGLEVANATVVFERTRGRIAVLRPGDVKGLDGLRLSAEAGAQIEKDLVAGYVVVIPTEGARIAGAATTGWWRVRAEGGETLGKMEGGEGQSTIEKILVTLPSAYSTVASWLCAQGDSTHGWCDPCLLLVTGALGFVLGTGYGIVALNIRRNLDVAYWAVDAATGAYGSLTGGLACLDLRLGRPEGWPFRQ